MRTNSIIHLFTGLFLIFFFQEAYAQKNKTPVIVECTVVDENGTAIEDVKVHGMKFGSFAMTDEDGAFSIEVPKGSVIVLEKSGYEEITVPVRSIPEQITLFPSAFLTGKSDEITVPFGKQNRKSVNGAITNIDVEKLQEHYNTQWVNGAINGRIPGIIKSGSNNIRGLGGATIIVDGIPRPAGSINLEEVDEITVLRDVHSALLYGVQADRGIILITTKRGTPYKNDIKVTVEQGISRVKRLPSYLGAADYMTLYNEARQNDGLDPVYDSLTIAHTSNGVNPYRYPDLDYYSDEFLKSQRGYSRVITEFRGGNDNSSYYLNLGWQNTGTIFNLGEGKNSGTNQLNLRGNVDVGINDFIDANLDVVSYFDVSNYPNGNFWNQAANRYPNAFSPLLPYGVVQNDSTLSSVRLYQGEYLLGGTSQYTNSVYGDMLYGGFYKTNRRTMQINTGLDFDLSSILKGLSFETYLSFDVSSTFAESQSNSYAVYQPTWLFSADSALSVATDSLVVTPIGVDKETGVLNVRDSESDRRIGVYGVLDYSGNFNASKLDVKVLGFMNKYSVVGWLHDRNYAHLGMHAGYSLLNKLYLDFNGAYVHSTRFIESGRAAFSPSAGIGYVLSEDAFLSGASWINFLKIRATAGIMNTDQNINSFYLYEDNLTFGGSFGWNDGGMSGKLTRFSIKGNPNLSFEKRNEINLGLDAVLFDQLLWVDLNAFMMEWEDRITTRNSTLPGILGGFTQYYNYNADSYNGLEAGIRIRKEIGTFKLDLGTNITYMVPTAETRDEVWENDYQYRAGKSRDAIFGLVSDGFYSSEDFTESGELSEGLAYPLFGGVQPGDIKYIDQNDDGFIDNNDRVQIGNSLPRLSGGIDVLLSYGDFSIYAIFSGRMGSDVIYSNDYYWVSGNDKYSDVVLNRWTEENAESADYPRLSSKNNNHNFTNSDFWLDSEDMFSWDRLQINYHLPYRLTEKLNLQGMKVFVTANDLLLVSKIKSKMQLNIGSAPQFRNYSIGIRVEL